MKASSRRMQVCCLNTDPKIKTARARAALVLEAHLDPQACWISCSSGWACPTRTLPGLSVEISPVFLRSGLCCGTRIGGVCFLVWPSVSRCIHIIGGECLSNMLSVVLGGAFFSFTTMGSLYDLSIPLLRITQRMQHRAMSLALTDLLSRYEDNLESPEDTDDAADADKQLVVAPEHELYAQLHEQLTASWRSGLEHLSAGRSFLAMTIGVEVIAMMITAVSSRLLCCIMRCPLLTSEPTLHAHRYQDLASRRHQFLSCSISSFSSSSRWSFLLSRTPRSSASATCTKTRACQSEP